MTRMNRRDFLHSATQHLAIGAVGSRLLLPRGLESRTDVVDRKARLARHSPVVRTFESFSALSVGNGGFAFTADATGLQTFPEHYAELPLATQAEWAWHSFPNPSGYRIDDALVQFDSHGRKVPYASGQNGAAGKWLRENPHRLSLARIGFVLTLRDGTPAKSSDLTDVSQRLDLWSGRLESNFSIDGRRVRVLTWAHPTRDLIGVRIESSELDAKWLAIRIAFPYGIATHTGDPSDWSHADLHRTDVADRERSSVSWHRTLDADDYWARAKWSDGGTLRLAGPHEFRIEPAPGSSTFECTVAFSKKHAADVIPTATATGGASAAHWQKFWSEGGTLDLSGSTGRYR